MSTGAIGAAVHNLAGTLAQDVAANEAARVLLPHDYHSAGS